MQLPGQWSLKPRSEKGDDVLGVFGGVLVIPCLPPWGLRGVVAIYYCSNGHWSYTHSSVCRVYFSIILQASF